MKEDLHRTTLCCEGHSRTTQQDRVKRVSLTASVSIIAYLGDREYDVRGRGELT